jgi:hypothetical protein
MEGVHWICRHHPTAIKAQYSIIEDESDAIIGTDYHLYELNRVREGGFRTLQKNGDIG